MRFTAIMLTLSVAILAPLAAVQDPDVRLQKVIQQEITSGDLRAAIAEYRRIAEDSRAARAVRARALLRMADAHRRLGDEQAQRIYASIVANFSDQADVVAQARKQLAGMASGSAQPTRQARQIWVGADTTGTVAFDGSILSYTDWETGDLAIRTLDTGNNRRLTESAGWAVSSEFAEFSVPSRDGSQVAYAWHIEKPTLSYELRVIGTGPGGQKPRTLLKGTTPAWIRPQAWTPDGRQLVVLRVEGSEREFLVVDVATGNRRTIRKHEGQVPNSIKLSPDGRYIAYAFLRSEEPRQREIAILPIDGSRDPVIITHPAQETEVDWSPDGSRIIFVSDRTGTRALWTMPVAAGRPSGRAEIAGNDVGRSLIGMTRTGALLYARGGGRRNVSIATLDTDLRAGEIAVASDHFVDSTSGGVWSPDGTRLAYYALRGAPQSTGSRVIVIKTLATNEERAVEPRVVVPEGNGIGLQWFPDGRALLVVGRGRTDGTLDYYRIDSQSGESQLMFSPDAGGPGANDPQLSADGQSIYFVGGSPPGRRMLARYDLKTKQITVLQEGWFGSIALAPEGQLLAYVGSPGGTNADAVHIGIIPLGGGERTKVIDFPWTGNVRQNSLGWSADGSYILFVRPEAEGQQQGIWRVPPTGGQPTSLGIHPGGVIKRPRMHPDGKRIALSLQQQVPTELWILENFLPPTAAKK